MSAGHLVILDPGGMTVLRTSSHPFRAVEACCVRAWRGARPARVSRECRPRGVTGGATGSVAIGVANGVTPPGRSRAPRRARAHRARVTGAKIGANEALKGGSMIPVVDRLIAETLMGV